MGILGISGLIQNRPIQNSAVRFSCMSYCFVRLQYIQDVELLSQNVTGVLESVYEPVSKF